MTIEDLSLPAVAELSSARAVDVLRPVVVAAGGVLHGAQCVQLHYLPGRELVARYEADVSWPSGRRRDTLLAATTTRGVLPGALPVVADGPDGPLHVSVWRWPFDPLLPGLETAATPSSLAAQLGELVTAPLDVEVVAYRPTERAVLRVTDAAGARWYLKVVPSAQIAAIHARHRALSDVGVPVPAVLHADESLGLLVLAPMPGATFRDHLKGGGEVWPDASGVARLVGRIATARLDGPSNRASRVRDGLGHAALLRRVLPDTAGVLGPLEDRFAAALDEVASRSGTVVHGDLHEAQLFLDGNGAIVGVIDLDDVGRGDPLDDPAVLLGHLEYRAMTTTDPVLADRLHRFVGDLRADADRRFGRDSMATVVAAVLVGLSTGPFRLRSADWPHRTRHVLAAAAGHLAAAGQLS